MPKSPSVRTPRTTTTTPARNAKSPRGAVHSPTRSSGGPSTLLPRAAPDPDALPLPPSTLNKPTPTFTSCLSIPVQGAKPISRPDPPATATGPTPASAVPSTSAAPANHPQTPAPASTTPQTSRRAPRKSKTDALAALQTHAQSSEEPDDTDPDAAPAQGHPRPDPAPIPVAPALDFAGIRTSSPRDVPPTPTPRPFGLEDCPTYYPTQDDFRDPMAYVRKISEQAREYGMCKVVPPPGWKMPFVTDTEVSPSLVRHGLLLCAFLRHRESSRRFAITTTLSDP